VVIWGTGSPRREFLYSDDMADACVMMMNLPDEAFGEVLRAPTTSRSSTSDAARPDHCATRARRGVGGRISRRAGFDTSNPTEHRASCSTLAGFAGSVSSRTDLKTGIAAAYKDYLDREGGAAKLGRQQVRSKT